MPFGQPIKEPRDFPQTVICYLHSSTDSMWELGEGIGLEGDGLMLFRHALCEVKIKISVNKDGTYEILEIGE